MSVVPADTWQGWLVFERESDWRRFSTPVETTQPNAEAVVTRRTEEGNDWVFLGDERR